MIRCKLGHTISAPRRWTRMNKPSVSVAPSPTPSSLSTQRRLSGSSNLGIAGSLLSNRASSASSIHSMNGDVVLTREKGLRHANVRLDARHYKTSEFAGQLLIALRAFGLSSWLDPLIAPEAMKIHKVSGALTNAIFFVSCPSHPRTRTLLLRLYGPSSGRLISRRVELHILHALSSRYGFGPRVYGTLENGRVEEYFESVTLTPTDVRDAQISRWIATRMAELHSVDIEVVLGNRRGGDDGFEIGVTKNVRSWLRTAREVVALPGFPASRREGIDLDLFATEWKQYSRWLATTEDAEGPSRRVFAHNDAQYGNLLRLKNVREGAPEYTQIIVVDFEYASPNPAAFDIANHFIEWTTDYNAAIPERLDHARYPSFDERRNFYSAYLKQSLMPSPAENRISELEMRKLDRQVQVWHPSSHAMWAIWSLVQAREDIENENVSPEFDYAAYASNRMEAFRQSIRKLGI